jgi:protein-tyrosine phosphatase
MKVASILVVCVGNLCRSPTGQYLLSGLLSKTKVSSAGLVAAKAKPACSVATEVAASNGVDITPHVTTRLTPELVMQNELVLVMEGAHVRAVHDLVPYAHGKVMLFGKWEGETEIPDPYRRSRSIYQTVFAQLQNNAQRWAEKLDDSK